MGKTIVSNGNKLIAEFMGKHGEKDQDGTPIFESPNGRIRWTKQVQLNSFKDLSCLKYHSSWDWLMPVVGKIEGIYEDESTLPRININSHYCEFNLYFENDTPNFNCIAGCIPESPEKIIKKSKLEAVYYVVVEFIKWYNKNK